MLYLPAEEMDVLLDPAFSFLQMTAVQPGAQRTSSMKGMPHFWRHWKSSAGILRDLSTRFESLPVYELS